MTELVQAPRDCRSAIRALLAQFFQFPGSSSVTPMAKNAQWLPPVPFGDSHARISKDSSGCHRALNEAIPSLRSCDPIGNADQFRQRAITCRLKELCLVATANTPMSVKAERNDQTLLLVPFHGSTTLRSGTMSLTGVAGESAIFVRGRNRAGDTINRAVRSSLCIALDINRLARTVRDMLGLAPDDDIPVDFEKDRTVPLIHGEVSFDTTLRRLCNTVDAHVRQPALLLMMGIDDAFYRTIAMALAPATLLPAVLHAADADDDAERIRKVCDHIKAHIADPIHLTDLEHVFGRGARTLQLAFLRRLGVSPTRWIRDQRLELARQQLESADNETSVAAIATRCGFARLATFTREYTARFGELPSKVLDRRRA
jgi:AraC-like DNA-binding protein